MKHVLLTVLLLSNVFLGQVTAAPFEVGDRVDAAIPGGGVGTVLEVGHGVPYDGFYKVNFDRLHAHAPKEGMWVDPKRYPVTRLGPDGLPMAAAPATSLKPQVPRQSEPKSAQNTGRAGTQEADFKALIRSRYHGSHGVTMDLDFHSFQIGPRSRYEHVYAANGRGHVYQAWPVTTSYRVVEHYQGEDLIREYEGKYWCFEDIHGEWLAVQGGGFKISAARYVKR